MGLVASEQPGGKERGERERERDIIRCVCVCVCTCMPELPTRHNFHKDLNH